ncbi:hypothetical protein [Rhodococcus koreensis]|uniref:hypothetical protein n=1 Tax=Rhodococcus koreensis TaxID=99653 RepID=UPI0036DCDE77
MTVASFVMSALALTVSGASLGWNVLNFILTGQRAELSISVVRPLTTTGETLEPVVQITVRGTGRVPIEVTGWSLTFPENFVLHSALVSAQYGQLRSVYLGDQLPKTIQPGGSGSFNLPTIAIEKSVENYQLDSAKGHIQVHFAARKPLRDKKPVAERLNRTN